MCLSLSSKQPPHSLTNQIHLNDFSQIIFILFRLFFVILFLHLFCITINTIKFNWLLLFFITWLIDWMLFFLSVFLFILGFLHIKLNSSFRRSNNNVFCETWKVQRATEIKIYPIDITFHCVRVHVFHSKSLFLKVLHKRVCVVGWLVCISFIF